MKSFRLLSLDGLRGIAALSVVIYHYFYRIDEIYSINSNEMDWTYFGKYGVHLFFMISGFVIFMSIKSNTKPISFFISRFTRLYPAYFFAVIITFTVVYIFGLEGREVSFLQAILNLLMFQEFLGIAHVDGVYWTLTVEITFYFWCLILILLNRTNFLVLLLFVFSFLSLISELLPSDTYKVLNKLFFINYVSFFLLGVLTFKLKSNNDNYKNIGLVILVFSGLFVNHNYQEFIVFVVIYMFFLVGVFEVGRFLELKVFVFLGEISYSLYLIHQNIGYIIMLKIMSMGFSQFFAAIGAFIVSVFLARFLYKYAEVKLGKFIKINFNNKLKEARV